MAIQVQTLKRVFRYNSLRLPDPAPTMTPDQVRDLYSATYAELATAVVEGPETKNGEMVFSFKKQVGTKG